MSHSPFDLDNNAGYQRWRAAKMACCPTCAEDLLVDLADPRSLTVSERQALLARCASSNMVIYRSQVTDEDKGLLLALGRQLGLRQLDGNWLADEDGISPISVSQPPAERMAFIPYTNRPIKWHTDGYYQPPERRIRGMILHCVRPAAEGGVSALMDHEMAYIALRDSNPQWIRALMQDDAMTIPERLDDDGIARAAQSGPVFSVDAASGALHMRYTARTRSVLWRDDAPTAAAVAALEHLLASDNPHIFRLQLQAGMGLLCNNVLHDRSGFTDDPAQPRLLYRARYLDRISPTQVELQVTHPAS